MRKLLCLTLLLLLVAPAASQAAQVPDYFGMVPNYANSPLPRVNATTGAITGGMRKFADPLPNLPIAHPDTTTFPGCDYYEISLQQYTAQMHADLTPTRLPGAVPTKLRGYVQTNNGTDPITGLNTVAPAPIQYLGPVIVATTGRPVRVKFTNQLPNTAGGGNLFIPVDTTYMGAGMGPDGVHSYAQNRATLHLHGGATPWISDGTPHQWTTPATESTPYPEGVSVHNVPDMDGGTEPQGTLTFYYTNQQSARLMFYHDHAYGITRLNVYAGEAAGYLLTDAVEQAMIAGGSVTYTPTGAATGTTVSFVKGTLPDVGTPLVIQDKTFVPNNTLAFSNTVGAFPSQLAAQDPTWDTTLWGGPGSLWWPHVYMTNQNPWDMTGMNPMGRWDYGPWFWPPFTGLVFGPIANPYYDPINAPWEPPFIPGTPDARLISPTGVPESFMDTPLINGKAYPVLGVKPKLYRFRILNACNDRYLNLQLYQAASGIVGTIKLTNPGSGYTFPPPVTITGDGQGAVAVAGVDLIPGSPTYGQVDSLYLKSTGTGYTTASVSIAAPATLTGITATATVAAYTKPSEVAMVPFNSTQNSISPFPASWYTAGNPFSLDDRDGGVPDPNLRGPAMIQVGTEGGFLPGPAVINNVPINFDYNRRSITVLNVLQHALFLGPAERADILVDFSQFAGKTLILYNDSPAPVPAGDPRLDYYTGDPDQTNQGGAPTTLPGYGPNTRTLMKIVVTGTNSGTPGPVDYYNPVRLALMQSAMPKAFAASQPTIIVPQAPYNAVYNGNFPGGASAYVKIQDTTFSFTPIGQASPLTMTMMPKSIIEDFQPDYGRMNAMLGNEIPNTNIVNQTSIIQHYNDPPVEIVKVSDAATPIGALDDGTQIWKFTHNGVDTHAIHFHMFNVQLVNRAGWDGSTRPPDANELGWKDTIRMNPLEDAIVALKPMPLGLPWDLPNSVRLLDVTMPPGATVAADGVNPLFTNVDPNGNPVTISNQLCNYGWEYVYHCHLLGHEENDMMRPMAIAVPPVAPSGLTAQGIRNPTVQVRLKWTDNSLNETSFFIQRATDPLFTQNVNTFTTAPNATTFIDTTVAQTTTYYYSLLARNTVGSSVVGYPTINADSAALTATVRTPAAVVAPSNLVATKASATSIGLSWRDNSNNETGFAIWRSVNGAPFTQVGSVGAAAGTGSTVTFTNTGLTAGNTYRYYVVAMIGTTPSAPSNTVSLTL